MKKPISATIDHDLIKWLDDVLRRDTSFRNKSHIIELALLEMKAKLKKR